MRYKSVSLVGAAALCVSLGGCDRIKGWFGDGAGEGADQVQSAGGKPGSVEKALSDPRDGAIDKLLGAMTPEVRAEFDRLLPEAKASLNRTIAEADGHPQRIEHLASFLTDNDKEISLTLERAEGYQKAWKEMRAQAPIEAGAGASEAEKRRAEIAAQYLGNSASDRQRLAGQLAEVLAELEARRSVVSSVLKRDRILAEAYKVWRMQKSPGQTISQVTTTLLTQPCRLDWSNSRSIDSFLSFRGVALGLTEPEVMKAVCASNGNSVNLVGRAEGSSHDLEDIEMENEGTEIQKAAQSISKPYLRNLTFCFDCLDSSGNQKFQPGTADSNLLGVTLLPNGRVAALDRIQPFVERSDSGPVDAPRKLSLLLPELEKQFGKPSFLFDEYDVLTVAWVYLDRKSPLPLERWYFTPAPPSGWKLQFRSDNLIYEGGTISRKLIARQKPVASFCAVKYGSAGTRSTDLHMGFLTENRVTQEKAVVNVSDCGVVVTAQFFKKGFGGEKPPEMRVRTAQSPVDLNTNVYRVEMTIRDVTAMKARQALEIQQIKSAAASASQQFERKAANPEGPAFRP